MGMRKKLSNPFSTGGGGVHFEAHVQASFVALMLTGGHAPCLPCWPIVEVKLQGKIDGFDTDDLVVVVENPSTKERRKLLGQVKNSISITQNNTTFGEVMQAAWNDFTNPKVFTRGKDRIALITGPLNATDVHNVQWLLGQARHTNSVGEFLRNVKQANFSPPKSAAKLEVIRHHLKAANGGSDVSDDDLYDFLNDFCLLGYDLGEDIGVVLSLLHSHISQFQKQYTEWAWSRVVDIVQAWNKDAGTVTCDKLPDDLLEAFRQKAIVEMPAEFKVQASPSADWIQPPSANYLALVALVGAWQDKSDHDREAITCLLGIGYDEWLNKAREILHTPNSPLSLKNGVWKVADRAALLSQLGSRILDQNLEKFQSLAVYVLNEPDPAFELRAEDRYAASIYGKVLKYSGVLRKGLAEGLAILGNQPEAFINCSHGKSEAICVRAVRELLINADWVLWGSLNDLLPLLAEAAPGVFLDLVEDALRQTTCPFDELFSQEGKGITGRNYLTGLLWALEGLAWEEQYLVRVCVVLAELASHDPGGQWANRPSNSLTTILLPWLPQTLASVEKRKVAVQTVLKEQPDVAWSLLIQLLPGQVQTSSGSHKPSWRKAIPVDSKKGVTEDEYWKQASHYAELAVTAADHDVGRLSTLIDRLNHLPKPAFEQFLQILSTPPISELPEEERLSLWERLTRFTKKHRRFSDTKWALPDELISQLEAVAEKLAPADPFNRHKPLFSDRDYDLYEERGNWKEQREALENRRRAAVSEIFCQRGIQGVIQFAESVSSPFMVGRALDAVDDLDIERSLLPHFLCSESSRHKALASGFVWQRCRSKGWDWCDSVDKTDWTPEQVGQFLACLPFTKEAWDRASEWLGKQESEYWIKASANAYEADEDLAFAIEKLIEHGRPHAAIDCLNAMIYKKQPIEGNQCVRALLSALTSSEPRYAMDPYHILELIKLIQTDPSVSQDDLFKVEWAYLPLLDHHNGASPKLLESRLANDPDFFCEVIRLIYRSKKDDQPSTEPSEEAKAIATNAWRLLDAWKVPPGTQEDGNFDEKRFAEWLQRVKTVCAESGHLEVALTDIGKVLIYAPQDPGGLWIHRAIADALDDREADDMRNGFRTGTYNSRGFHWVDPTGEQERELARQFRRKAEEVENEGFHRFAVTLRSLAGDYEREAEHVRLSSRADGET